MKKLESRGISRRQLCLLVPALSASWLGNSVDASDQLTPRLMDQTDVPKTELQGSRGQDTESEESQILGNRVARLVTWPVFKLTNQWNQPVELYRDVLAKRSVVLNFFYSRCDGSCPITLGTMSKLAALQKELGRSTTFVSITLDPRHDQPSVLKKYSADLVSPQVDWHFLTGSLVVTEAVRRFLGFYDLNEPQDVVLRRHAAMVLFGNDETHRWITLPAESSFRQWRSSLARCSTSST